MITKQLSGIERELVLQYLIDGNVPVTLTVLEDTKEINSNKDRIQSLTSQVFPVAIKAEHVNVKENGEIELANPPSSAKDFAGKTVKVEFYYNRVGLFFTSEVKQKNENLILLIPAVINRIADIVEETQYNFSALIYFECKTTKDLNLKCIPTDGIELFERPVWKLIPLENQKKAKELLEKYVNEAKIEKNIGNGLQLIPVCHYLTNAEQVKMEAMENRVKPLNVLYVDYERIVFGFDYTTHNFVLNDEYGIKLIFSLKKGPIVSRDIYVTAQVNKLYKSEDERKMCVDFKYTTLQEEDLRFLYEKATKNLFI